MNSVGLVTYVISSDVLTVDEKAQFISHPLFVKLLSAPVQQATSSQPSQQHPLEAYKAWLFDEISRAKPRDQISFVTDEYIKSDSIRTWVHEYIAANHLGVLTIGAKKYIITP